MESLVMQDNRDSTALSKETDHSYMYIQTY